ncbi:LpxL/LpxP family Kdo(2)-lipid IV(A) lauroyl/palmitoleoyl acyltransferase [Pasteurella skyensis]|uniref:Lipid A biosynthesis acyltransferase n=1 Tax=Phocoenobacter skyensis TaxID=97481 RepID=A0AAJ6NBI8_9PAST|nr:LpxL/LpxP family Kdo(2)-lipid IV(A) lauroyl/palmitoleoyl acyltransferase [Pasteurella skyensis]MDP8163389.1 LpxL/LpxP family Kdo(2)-lipid IV(A) lauroyl/palmitoleoyl acyltransferase [Pasteurella skyensis]MDP8173631.1 LpxL/LpxP family Kdo(2)-lipid IV(A) lauroyl/palmitoleoyl acyltransferase [Pasteurella skyensis]MDP8179831.1 LpxL/LpxP family Kdo(2)-lipid IV(A) lauroyl/palmitoleoyl acyltransferase [Pasteurella skyensis]MDP8183945.1 LpxL/LpxP family Kdo(2)-lipid IV(A) lauroyl/palmitoleoyl acyltra
MNNKNKSLPFQKIFLHPKYWGLWIGLGFFRLVLLLPYPLLVQIAKGFSYLFKFAKFGKYRTAIAKRNLELCFPEYTQNQIEQLIEKNIESIGMAIIETGMAWFWSDQRILKWSKFEGIEHLKQAEKEQKGIILVGVHFLTLELGARIMGLHHQGIGVYRPNDNPLLDWIQFRGRVRSNKAMLNRNDLRGMIKALRQGEMIWYAPDHDYGRKASVFVPFFNVEKTATTTGTRMLLRSASNAVVIPFSPIRNQDGTGYTLMVSPPVDFSQCTNDIDTATLMNKVVKKEIMNAPEQYMWLHRRFKTRPNEEDPSLYD